MRRFLLILLSGFSVTGLAQDRIKLDSLELVIKSAEEDTTRIKALISMSELYYNVKAIEYTQRARDIAVKNDFKKWIAKSDAVLANIFVEMGDYKNAASSFFKAFEYYENVQDTLGMGVTYNNLGTVYDRLHDFDKALEYYLKSQQLLGKQRPGNHTRLMSSLYNNIANVYQTKHDIPSAKQYYEKALALAIEYKHRKVEGIALNNLGKLHFLDMHEFDVALDYLNRGLKVRQELGDKAEIAKSYSVLAGYYYKSGKFSEALVAANQTIKLGEETGSLESQKAGYSSLADVEEALGHYPQSLEAYKAFKKMNDSIQNQLASSEMTRLQLQYDFQKAEQTRAAEQQQSRFRYITTIVILTVGLIIAVLIVMIVRNRAKQTELKRRNLLQDVEIKNKELTTNVMYLIRKNELINSVAERLLKMQDSLKPENHKAIHDIVLDLQKEADNDSWKEFELRFHQVHSEFYKNLRQLYPGLSPADEKLCAFLRLNMSSKEIAAITQQSIKSVEVARARLRKKLNLTNTTSNLVTHLSNL